MHPIYSGASNDWQTSTQSAWVMSAIFSGLMRTALFTEPAAGITMS